MERVAKCVLCLRQYFEESLEEFSLVLARRVILLKLSDGIDCEEAHVVGVDEADVVEMVLLLEDDVLAELLREPGDVLWRGQAVDVARKENSRHLVVLERDGRCVLLPVELLVFDRAVVVEGEVTRPDRLRVVDESSVGLPRREHLQAELKSGHIIDRFVDKNVDEILTKVAKERTGGVKGLRAFSERREPVVKAGSIYQGKHDLVDVIRSKDHLGDGDVRSGCHRGQSDKQVDLFLEIRRVERSTKEELRRTLRVANVRKILQAGRIQDMVNERWHVLETQVALPVVPVLLVVGGQAQVAMTELAATVVAQPHVVALTRENKGVRFVRIVKHILHHVGVEGVDEKNGRLRLRALLFDLAEGAGDAVERQDVVVGGDHIVLLALEAIFHAELLEGFAGVDGLGRDCGER
mmetsp:Transcript_16914/g.21404  ORF Transcript_16914/g.21404 Transcript_16914/m.21404 type:complete len:409 (-) Transcript_16914:66-1292(-)|eukprot:CAMPEP_0170466524 /NCGR_PEP_ID=MMETSP0123-20130129/10453_1 /TAXON_ID=182087 /ORGANISM="Favella ehrenbergii, Strain Fehren 1" /LENGTH=408 /DNA_ID=CAMNT_0010732677 /DNA_START=215 /DNA_END=1441 /DNA_ORIENTATION=+